MPVTPFHLMAGVAVKSFVRSNFSWTIFALTNIIIDIEVVYYYIATGIPSHKFFHTFLGSTIIVILCATVGRYLCQLGLKLINLIFTNKVIKFDTTIHKKTAWISAFIGAYSHVLFDCFANDDMRPLYPFSEKNLLLGLLSNNFMMFSCTALFLIGILVAYLKYRNK